MRHRRKNVLPKARIPAPWIPPGGFGITQGALPHEPRAEYAPSREEQARAQFFNYENGINGRLASPYGGPPPGLEVPIIGNVVLSTRQFATQLFDFIVPQSPAPAGTVAVMAAQPPITFQSVRADVEEIETFAEDVFGRKLPMYVLSSGYLATVAPAFPPVPGVEIVWKIYIGARCVHTINTPGKNRVALPIPVDTQLSVTVQILNDASGLVGMVGARVFGRYTPIDLTVEMNNAANRRRRRRKQKDAEE